MKTLRTLLAPLLLLLAALPAGAEPAPAPAARALDLTPAMAVVEIAVDPAARMQVIAAPGPAANVARRLAARLVEERAELEGLLGGLDAGPIEIRFAHGRSEFEALQPRGGKVPGWAAGVAWTGVGLVVIDVQAAGRGGDPRGVLRHELAHVALGRLVQGPMPRWFTEGFAQLYAGEWTLSRNATLARATVADALIPIRDLEDGWPGSATDADLAYAQSVSLVSFLGASGDRTALQQLIRLLADGRPFDEALPAAWGAPQVVLELDWKETLRDRYGWLPILGDVNLLYGLAALLLVVGAWRARRRSRARIEEMADGPDFEEQELPEHEEEKAFVEIVFPAAPPGGWEPTHPTAAASPVPEREGPQQPDDDEALPPPGGWRH